MTVSELYFSHLFCTLYGVVRFLGSWSLACSRAGAFLAFAIAVPAVAGTSYQDPIAYDVALPGIFRNLDYDALAPSTLLPSGSAEQSVALSYSLEGATVKVVDAFDTSTPANSVGLSGGDEALLDGDTLTLDFGVPVRGVGLFIITSDPAVEDEITLSTPLGSVGNAAMPLSVTPDGGHVYFLGRIENLEFNQATLGFAADGEVNFVFNLDDVTTAVEAVSTWIFSGTAVGGTVSFTVNGVALMITTTAGQTAGQVAQAVADAINGNATLLAAGTAAEASGDTVDTNGEVTDTLIADPGLNHEAPPGVPALPAWGLLVLAFSLLVAGRRGILLKGDAS